ncbi:hypothetical protein AA13595_0054 [Gluconacetobacter johannae DSM 13595]|nr:hypothetical protein AA13595_0054 [Gluconacetobacter johannae DSM 13595]
MTKVIAPCMVEGEPRILDTDLATRLGFDRPRDIRKLTKRWEAEPGHMGQRATVVRRSENSGLMTSPLSASLCRLNHPLTKHIENVFVSKPLRKDI